MRTQSSECPHLYISSSAVFRLVPLCWIKVSSQQRNAFQLPPINLLKPPCSFHRFPTQRISNIWKVCSQTNVSYKLSTRYFFFLWGHSGTLESDSSFHCTIKILTDSELLALKFWGLPAHNIPLSAPGQGDLIINQAAKVMNWMSPTQLA